MPRFDGSLARALDFGTPTTTATPALPAVSARQPALRLARPHRLSGPDKYRILERRRREAQMRARHLLELLDIADAPRS